MTLNQPYGVVVLYNESKRLIKGEERDFIAENDVILCASHIAKSLSINYKVEKVPIKKDLEIVLKPYNPTQWVIFNLGEGIEGRLFEAARIAWALEAMGFCFTGAGGDNLALTTNKAVTKSILRNIGIVTPRSWLFTSSNEIKEDFQYPLIVKPVAEDASLGIDKGAIVYDEDSLKRRIDYIQSVYCQCALVEKFIAGREFNIAIWDNPLEVLPLCEIDFSAYTDPHQQIVSYAAKWDEESFDYHNTPGICPAQVGQETATLLNNIGLDCWYHTKCKDYARIDIRIDINGTPFVMEINSNPDLSPEAGFYRAAKTAGYSYGEMIQRILESAVKRFTSL